MNKVMLKWTPAVPLPNKDNIISSCAKASNEKGFQPSYETEGRPNMYSLLNNEYMRIWFRERGQYEKEVYTKKEMMKEESKIKRRFVQKDLTRKEKKKNVPVIKLKRFQNIASKTDNHQEVKNLKEEKTPALEEKASTLEEKTPILEEKTPILEEKSPILEEKSPILEEKSPILEVKTPTLAEKTSDKEQGRNEDECKEKIVSETELKQTTEKEEPYVGEELNQVQKVDEIKVPKVPKRRCRCYLA